jgi:hypothetical protein
MWVKNRDTKICARCKELFPATEEYFFRKVCKYKLVNGAIKTCNSLRHVCKKCKANIETEKRLKKRYSELGCNSQNYKESYIKEIAFKKLRFKEFQYMSGRDRADVLRKYRTTGKFMTEEQYNEYLYKQRTIASLKHRKYNYGNVERVTPQMVNTMSLLYMTDSRIALIMGMSVKDAPKEIIEAKRALIMLKREAGLIHSTKSIKTKI